jgi:hypothetical protein
MQSAGGDIGYRSPYATWNWSNKYLASQVSLTSSDAYQPSGSPWSLFDGLEGVDNSSEGDGSEPSPVSEEEEIGVQNADPFIESAPGGCAEEGQVYGPSKEEVQDLFDREAKWEEGQRRRDRQPLIRLASLSKDFKGEVKRRLSGKGKGFEARAKRREGEGSMSGKGFRKSI